MKSTYDVLPLIEYIKNKESNRYGIDINIDSPNFKQYYEKYIKNNNLDISEILSRFLSIATCCGYADDETGEVVIFNKNYAANYKFNDPFDFFGIINLNDVLLAMITFHEIRHILQDTKLDMFNEYEYFCLTYLRVMNHKYLLNTEFHDSQYFEIDANLYGACEVRKMFNQNKRICKFLDKEIASYTYQKCLYEFEEYLNYFIKSITLGKYSDSYDNDDFMKTFWNDDGSFKTISEMVNNPKFLYGGLLESRIITSDAHLSSLKYDDLSNYDRVVLKVHLNNNIKFITDNIETLDELYKNKKISKSMYKDGLKELKDQIFSKENYRRLINDQEIIKKRKFIK